MTNGDKPRAIRSFVIRAGRTTPAQQRALKELWPRYGVDFSPVELNLDELYGRRAPRMVEIGFGNGENLAALAANHPNVDYLGIEVHPPGVGHLLRTLAASHLTNVRVSCHDAVEVFAQQLPAESLDEVLVLFPDPWPKKRHHKRRLIQTPFAQCVAARLKSGALLRLATDWQPYAEHMQQALDACHGLERLASGLRPQQHERIVTRFEQRGERLGHSIWELVYRRR